MIVYRVENDQGIGPFNACLRLKLWLYGDNVTRDWDDHFKQFPGFVSDFGGLSNDYICSCPTIEILLYWFGKFIDILRKEGFDIVEYETESFVIGESRIQVAFNKRMAKRL